MKLKLLSFNIQHCRNFITREIEFDSIINLIKKLGADIIGLNEVYGKYEDNEAQYKILAEKLGYYYFFGQTITYRNIPYGNAILSKYKLKNTTNSIIPDPEVRDSSWYETRGIIETEFEDFNLNLLVSHYGLFDTEQENALKSTLNKLANNPSNTVFMGDLNMTSDNDNIKTLSKVLVNTHPKDTYTFPSIKPTKKIDYIFISEDIELIEAKIIKEVISDHFPHYAEIKIKA